MGQTKPGPIQRADTSLPEPGPIQRADTSLPEPGPLQRDDLMSWHLYSDSEVESHSTTTVTGALSLTDTPPLPEPSLLEKSLVSVLPDVSDTIISVRASQEPPKPEKLVKSTKLSKPKRKKKTDRKPKTFAGGFWRGRKKGLKSK